MANLIASVHNSASLTDATTATITVDAVEPPPPPPPPPGGLLAIQLDFTGGPTVSFSQASATDIGDYVGPFVRQKCFRQVIGDILVDFRPDADGMRDEVVVELGTLYRFASGVTPKTGSGNVPAHIGMPPPAQITSAPGSPSPQIGYLRTALTYVTPDGESAGGPLIDFTLAAGQRASVASPPPAMHATGYNVYILLFAAGAYAAAGGKSGAGFIRQNATPIPIGQAWTAPDVGALLTGSTFSNARPHTVAYTATITGGNLTAPVQVRVPMHYWDTRWRWQSAPRPLVRNYAALVAMKGILPLDSGMVFGSALPPLRPWQGPMDTGGFTTGMGQTADRPDIGPTTDWQAAWLLTGNAGCETTWRAGAESVGSWPFLIRDAATGALVDQNVHPRVSFNDSDLSRHLNQVPVARPSADPSYFHMDASHIPSGAFVPWLLTDDPYFLEGSESIAHYTLLAANYHQGSQHLQHLAQVSQPRGFAWGMRGLFQMAGFAPTSPPSWLMPRTYWLSLLPDNLTFMTRYLSANISPCTTVFKAVTKSNQIATFMTDYLGIVFAWAKWTGKFPEWDAVVDYITTPRRALSGQVGWDRRFQVPYGINIFNARLGATASEGTDYYWEVPASPLTPTSWSELWSLFCLYEAAGHQPGWTDPSTWAPDQLVSMQNYYLPEARGALAAMALAGLPNARDEYNWLAPRMLSQFPNIRGGYKFAISAT